MQRTQQQWHYILQAHADSDLSIQQFCREQGISTSSFYKYKSRLTKHATEREPSPFSQVQLIDDVTSTHTISLQVGKVSLTLNGNTNTRWLANLVEQLA